MEQRLDMKGALEVSVREIIQRASSSLLVRNTNAGNYDFDAGARLWGRDGVDGGTAVADAASVSSVSGALNASTHSLLRRLFSPSRRVVAVVRIPMPSRLPGVVRPRFALLRRRIHPTRRL
jgi:hypothetical protein